MTLSIRERTAVSVNILKTVNCCVKRMSSVINEELPTGHINFPMTASRNVVQYSEDCAGLPEQIQVTIFVSGFLLIFILRGIDN